ncbi:hypothetical protein RhiirB3_432491 [Rhizophagus irregularis]|nr:hypothetical protein RhiirB3_432491 [Rhizophagus irregularis]
MEIGRKFIFRSFDILIKQQLEPVWYRVSSKTKLIVNDLTTLRKLLEVYKLQKWNLLAEILREIESDITSHATETSRTSSEGGDLSHLNNTILIMENERERSLHQIIVHQLLVMTMNLMWKRFLLILDCWA